MATYTGIYKNLGVKLIVNQTSQNIANNSSVVSWYVYAYKSGTHHNPFNGFSQTPFKVTIDGVVVYNQNVNYNLEGRMEQLIASGTRTITHATDGTRSVAAQANADYTSTGYGYGAVVASGNLSLTTIPRISVPTLSTSSFNFGESVALTTNRSSTAFTHSIFYVIGTTEHSLATNVGESTNITIPNSRMSSYPDSTSATMSIRTKTYNGTTLLGHRDTEVTVNVPASIIPTIGTLTPTETVAAANIFSSNDTQYIRGLSKLKATAGTVAGNSGSTISRYYFRIVGPGGVVSGTEVNTTSSTYTYGTFNFPNKSQASLVYTVQCRVLDSRNRYSAWRGSSSIRVHYYEAPTINLSNVERTGSGNTSVAGRRTYNVQSIKEGGTTERNTGTFAVRFREKGASSWSTATGGTTGLTLSNSEAVLATGAPVNKFYEFQASVTDKIQTVYSSIVSVGSEFVTMEILKGTAVGIGIAPTTSGRDLYVGTGGLYSYGGIHSEESITGLQVNSNGSFKSKGVIIEQGRHFNFKSFTVAGSANSYYPVIISPQSNFGFHRYSISRGFNWTAPDTWNTSTHRGGLTFDFEWSGDINWGGNDKTVRVIEWNETYSTIVGGLKLARSGGLVVWLRGGGAEYRLTSERGMYAGVEVFLSGFTDASGENFPVRTSPVASEINSSYPVRGTGGLYEYGHRVITTNTISNYIPTITSGTNANGNWYNIDGKLLICWYRFSIKGKLTASQMNGSWTYPMPFAFAPAVSIGSRADDNTSSTNGYRRAGSTAFHQYNESATKTDILYVVNNGDVPDGPEKFLNIFAMGTPA